MAPPTAVAVRDISSRSVAGADTQAMRRVGLVRPTSNPAEVLEAHKAIAEMVAKVLEPGIDYGEIPGTSGPDGKNKKALLKPGAERLAFSIGASFECEVVEQEIDHHVAIEFTKRQKTWTTKNGKRTFEWTETHGTSRGLYRYVVKARLIRREDGAVLGEGVGSCSTLEAKYVDRPRESENTVLKMAKKRAEVDAVLTTMALSGRFAPDKVDGDDEDGDDGVVADPTDGLTLADALANEVNTVALGAMRPKALRAVRTWCDGKLQENPEDHRMLRLSAMIDMVSRHRETNPLPAKEAAAAEPAAPAPVATADVPAPAAVPAPPVDEDDDLPF